MFLSGGGKDRKVFLWDSNYNKSEKQLEVLIIIIIIIMVYYQSMH